MLIANGNLAELLARSAIGQKIPPKLGRAHMVWKECSQVLYGRSVWQDLEAGFCALSSVCVIQVVHTLLCSNLKLSLLLFSQKASDTG